MATDPTYLSSDIVELISNYVVLEPGRKVLKGNCPFHKDQASAFMVYPANNIFKCFGCGMEGSREDFILEIQNKNLAVITK